MARAPDIESMLPLKPAEFAVLVALAEQDRYGYDIVQRIAERTGGSVKLAPGNLYPVLDRLIGLGLIAERARIDRSDARRRYYGVTPQGRQVLAAETMRTRELLRTAERLTPSPARGSGR